MAHIPVKDIAAFVRARLQKVAKKSGRDFDAVLLQYLQERFLYRLTRSPYRRHLIYIRHHDLLFWDIRKGITWELSGDN